MRVLKNICLGAHVGLAALMVHGCGVCSVVSLPFQERGIGHFCTDQKIRAGINVVLLRHKVWNAISVLVCKGVVLLAGFVPCNSIKESITQDVRALNDVTEVVDYLTVGAERVNYMKDLWITQECQTKITARRLPLGNYHICCADRILYILGSVGSLQEKDALMDVANACPVRKVIEHLEVTGGTAS